MGSVIRKAIGGVEYEVEDRWVEIGDPAYLEGAGVDVPTGLFLAFPDLGHRGIGWPMRAADCSEVPGCGSLWGMPIIRRIERAARQEPEGGGER